MLSTARTIQFVFAFIVMLMCLCGVSIADERKLCGPEGISVEQSAGEEKGVIIRFHGEVIRTEPTELLGIETMQDKKGNRFLFLRLTEGGSCGDTAMLATVSDGRLITYAFDATSPDDIPCGAWRAYKPDKVLFLTVWMDICGLGWCHACGPSYQVMWMIDDCRDGKIVARRYKDIHKVYSDPDGRVQVKNMLKDLRERILRGDGEKPVSALSDPLEKEFCTRVVKADEGNRTLELLFSADSSIGDRFYFFDKTKGNAGKAKKQRKQ